MINKLLDLDNNHAPAAQNCCTVCRELPEYSKLYKCNMGGHIICNSCLTKLPKSGGARCTKCNSIFIKIWCTHKDINKHPRKSVTVEELFQLPSDQVNLLLNKSSLDKLENNHDSSGGSELINSIKRHQGNNLQIRKPLKCPLISCGKTVNSLSMKIHFTYDHPNIPTYAIKRSEELYIVSNVSIIEHGMNNCIGMIEVYDEYKFVSRMVNGIYKKDTQQVPVAMFWLMISGSHETEASKAHALYWLVTSSELPFKCTLEISSPTNLCSCATFCGVVDVRDNLNIAAIATKMNCLYLSYGSLLNLKGMWGEVNLRITVH